MLWTVLLTVALAGRWDDVDPDIEAVRVVAAPPEVVWTQLANTHTLESIFPRACIQDWVHGESHAGLGATVSMTYRWDVVRRRLAATIEDGREGAWFDLLHHGNKGFTTRFKTEPTEGGTKVTVHTWVTPPPWPIKARYFKTIQPAWTTCCVDALAALEADLAARPIPQRVQGDPKALTTGGPVAQPAGGATIWSSASCGERGYERRITLREDGTYKGVDLVSPCPPNARCVWSGVIHYSGTWVAEGEDAVLTESEADDGPGLARPARLRGDGEQYFEGECGYLRQ